MGMPSVSIFVLSCILPCFSSSPPHLNSFDRAMTSNNSFESSLGECERLGEEVFSYMDVFRYYHEKNQTILAENSEKNSLDDFVAAYREQNLSIDVFAETATADYISFLAQKSVTSASSASQDGAQRDSLQIISPDADYILGSNVNNALPTANSFFQREPILNAFKYSSLMAGDIVYEESSPSPSKHVAFLYNAAKSSSSYGNYPQTVEAVAGGVQYGFLDDVRMVDYGVVIYRIYRASELNVVSSAKSFLDQQIGDPYSLDFTKTDIDIDEDEWYCSELVFAAYYYGGMDIVSTINVAFDPFTTPVLPSFIPQGLLSSEVNIDYSYIDVSIASYETTGIFSPNKWHLNIYNPNHFSVLLQYNRKMCFDADAENWSDLHDISYATISSQASVQITIAENFFATTVALSFIKGIVRYNTYGNNLNKTNLSMQSHNCLMR